MADVTRLLQQAEHGDPNANAELLQVVYGELRRLANHMMTNEAPVQTLQRHWNFAKAWLSREMEKDK